MTKIKIADGVECEITFDDVKGSQYTGCCYISCYFSDVDCRDCAIHKRGLNGTSIEKSLISDLLVEKEGDK